jgi:hypothetical protein
MDEEELCLKFCANTVSANNEGMFNEEMYKEYMANEGMYSKCIDNECLGNECLGNGGMANECLGNGGMGNEGMSHEDEVVDVEAILPINEFDLLQEAHSIRNITPEILAQTDVRYRRYILTINDWTDRNNNDYSYVKDIIYEFLGTSVLETRKRLMKFIDTEIMMMINMCRIDEMGV